MKKTIVYLQTFLIFLFLLFCFPVQAYDISLPLEDEEMLVESYEYLKDSTNSLTLSDVISPRYFSHFNKTSPDHSGFIPSIKTYWLRFQVNNPGDVDNEWLLEFDSWSKVSFYSLTKNGEIDHSLVTGHLVPFNERGYPVGNKNYIPLSIPAGDTVQCYVRLHSIPDHTIVPTEHQFIAGLRSFIDKENNQLERILSFFFGVLLVMFFYHLFILASTRNISYFYYLAIVGITLYQMLNNSGYVIELFSAIPSFPLWRSTIESILSGLTVIMMILFTINILRTKVNMPFWHKVLSWEIGIVVVLNILSHINFDFFAPVMYLISFLIMVVFMIVGVLGVVRKLPSGVYYLIAFSFSVAGLIVLSLTYAGVLPKTNFGLHFAMPLGYSLQLIFFSLALANVINLLKKENSSNQEKIISQLQENQLLQTKVKRELEQKVQERTLEINKQKDIAEKAQIRAEHSEQAKQQFLANMSHEIRTPMHAISGMVKILKRNQHFPAQAVFLDAMKISSTNLLVLLNDILDLSKITAGKIKIERIPIEPADVIKNVYQILQYKAEEKGLQLDYEIAEDVPQWVMGDSARLNQVLTNLMGNAIKFTEMGRVTLRLSKQDESLLYEIRDTGIGIPPDKIQKIFKAFEQAEKSTTRRFGGTGLGLNISRQLVEAQKGKIWVESVLGEGSSFFVSLPLEAVEEEVAAKQSLTEDQLIELGSQLKGKHLLLAEDNEFNQMIAEDDLRYYLNDVSLEIVENGVDAYKQAISGNYDLVLMDVQMPEMNGLESSRKIREWEKENNKPRVPIIAMTASLLKEEISQCFTAGMDNYIPKPYKAEELVVTLYKELTKES